MFGCINARQGLRSPKYMNRVTAEQTHSLCEVSKLAALSAPARAPRLETAQRLRRDPSPHPRSHSPPQEHPARGCKAASPSAQLRHLPVPGRGEHGRQRRPDGAQGYEDDMPVLRLRTSGEATTSGESTAATRTAEMSRRCVTRGEKMRRGSRKENRGRSRSGGR
jgi:hypothetical protein